MESCFEEKFHIAVHTPEDNFFPFFSLVSTWLFSDLGQEYRV